MRKTVRKAVLWAFAIAVLLAIAIVLTKVFRLGMGAGLVFLKDAIPTALIAVCQDPVLIVAFVVAAILLWIFPWEVFGPEKQEEEEGPKDESNVLRGRKIKSFNQARQRAEVRLNAERARMRRERQGSRQRRNH